MQIGTNIDSCKDYSSTFMFADCFRMARAWGTAASPFDQKAVLDAHGNPVGDFGTVLMTSVDSPTGIYKLSFQGKADVSFPGSNAHIQNLVYDGTKTTADVVLAQGSQLFIAFKNPVNVSNVRLLRPNCTPDMLFNPQFIESLKPYRTIRFMDLLQTNNSPIKTWADRKRPDEMLQSGPRGIALEYCIELCNQTGCDMWLNIPHMADDDYVVQAAQLVHSKLDPLLNIYTEFSNEVWNSIFSQTEWNHQQAIKDVAAGQTDLQNGPTDTNTFYWGRRRVAKRISQIGKIFSQTFGPGTRTRPILATQAGDVSVGRAQLGYLSNAFGSPGKVIYGLAIAPYFATQADDVVGATIDTINAGLLSSAKNNAAAWIPASWDGKTYSATAPSNATMAKYYGVKLCFYECGQHLLGKSQTAQDLDLQVQSTQGMGDAYAAYFAGMDGLVDLACHFVNIGPWSKFGYWGLTTSYNSVTPKLKAVLDACQKYNGASMEQLKKQIADLQSQIAICNNQLSALSASNQKLQGLLGQIKALASQS
jgi:hypothetical protein